MNKLYYNKKVKILFKNNKNKKYLIKNKKIKKKFNKIVIL